LVVIDAHTGIVSTGSATANGGGVEIGPRLNGLENGALGTCVGSSLNIVSQRNVFDAQFIQESNIKSEFRPTIRSDHVAMSSNNGGQRSH
jgi:hypothetical protein